jgi:Ca2+:H+ antiporter|eukprot:TRINITY_DN813_c0_g2_i1.p1 TRINITY_DN813_c0_g2~~TRINITY_DN813_c0_g2_i1.p1  ORF type:complete len:444 (-),score=89.56 TRINITY_DN813_c0_g2_i1:61-1392(-)
MPPLRDIPTAETESSSPAVPRSGADDYSWVRHLHHRAELREKKKGSCSGLVHIFCSPICLMLFCLPVGLMSNYVWHNDTLTFWMMFGAMLPLAKILGDATEELALCLNNDMLSGLLNATFGNAVEMIMTVSFLQSHEYQVVKMTLIGSVLSNMLLVLGMSFFFGGLVKSKSKSKSGSGNTEPLMTIMEKEQNYSLAGALVNTSMLLVACLVLCLVTVFAWIISDHNHETSHLEMLPVSRGCSIIIMLSYIAFIVFQLFTHKETMADQGEDDNDKEEEPETSSISFACALGLLFGATIVVAFVSELLTGSLEPALASSGMSKGFVSIILLPIVGNACEHAAAIRFAMQDKVGLSVGIAVGSSVQIAIFVAPLSVLMGWVVGSDSEGRNMDLNFGVLDALVLTLSVIVVMSIVLDGKSTWLEGYMLMTAYAIIGVLYWFLPNNKV